MMMAAGFQKQWASERNFQLRLADSRRKRRKSRLWLDPIFSLVIFAWANTRNWGYLRFLCTTSTEETIGRVIFWFSEQLVGNLWMNNFTALLPKRSEKCCSTLGYATLELLTNTKSKVGAKLQERRCSDWRGCGSVGLFTSVSLGVISALVDTDTCI